MFDDTYNIREVLDDIIGRVNLREKLIQTAKQFSEKKREEKFTLAIRQFENLMRDFLRLYQPVVDRIRSYKESLQKELSSLRSASATVNGMLEVSKGIEGLASKVRELEGSAEELDTSISEKMKVLEKIDGFLSQVRPYQGTTDSSMGEPLSDVLGLSKNLYTEMPDTTVKETRKSSGRN